ncbi:peptidoglycan-binding protein [Microvirga sp. 2YAF29]|uniref:peptidoglycan-binding domain-containing protein n=1 Tax=Microvirga sp. 2YAF29 TaxID=3233031 RepID=UPI003F9E65FB
MTGSVTPSTFDLLSNAFALLGVKMTADTREIEDAFGDAVADEVAPEQDLQRARQILMTPRIRLEAEVSYLLDVDHGTVQEVLKTLKSFGLTRDAAAALSTKLHSLPRSNFLAHVHARVPADGSALAALLQAQAAAAPGAVLDAINDAREAAGMVKADREAVAQALRELFETQDKAVLATFTNPDTLTEAVTQAIEPLLETSDSALAERLDVFLSAYGQILDPELSRRLEAIRAACEQLKERPKDPEPPEALIRNLHAWSCIGRPLQILEEHKGRDDPRAREVFGEVREIYLWVANEHSQYSLSGKILHAAIEAFARLPRASEQMAEDLETLQSNLAFEPVRPLVEYIRELKNALTFLDADLRRGGFGAEATGQANRLFELFVAAVAGTKGTDLSDAPWMAIRDLAISLNNDLDAPQGALALLNGVLYHASRHPSSQEVSDRLKSDKRDIEGILAQRELMEHAKAGRHDEALAIVNRLLGDAQVTGEERDFLLKVRTGLEHQRKQKSKRLVSRLFWGGAAVVGIALYVSNQKPTPTRTTYSQPPYTAPAPRPTLPQPPTVPKSDPAPTVPARPDTEEMPPVGDGSRLFTASQIRYCLFQQVRLETIRTELSESQDVSRFNGMIDDWNSRCSRYRYRESEMTAAQFSLSSKRSELQAEGRRIASSMPSSPPPASSSTYNSAPAAPVAIPQTQLPPPASAPAPSPVQPLPPPVEIAQTPSAGAGSYAAEPSDLMRVENATRIQQRLADLGYFSGIVDGMWGPRSRTALRDFKLANGLARDDVWDERTETTLFTQYARYASGTLTSKTDRWVPADYPPPLGASLNPLNKPDAVRVQHRLSELGFYSGAGDGVWGLGSRYSLRDFKAVNNLPGDDSWDARTEKALYGSRVTRADETVIGVWARESTYCPTPGGNASNSLRITSYELEGLGRECKVLGLSRSAKNWTVTVECPAGIGNLGYVLSNGRLYREEDLLRYAYVRCPTN